MGTLYTKITHLNRQRTFLIAFKSLKLPGLPDDSVTPKAQGINITQVFEIQLLQAFHGKTCIATGVKISRNSGIQKYLLSFFEYINLQLAAILDIGVLS